MQFVIALYLRGVFWLQFLLKIFGRPNEAAYSSLKCECTFPLFGMATNSLGVQQASHGKSTKDRSNPLMPLTLMVMLSNLGGVY